MQAVVVHRGARDHYQLAAALQEAGLLNRLVTDLYWPADRLIGRAIERCAGARIRGKLRLRYEPLISSARAKLCLGSGAVSQAMAKVESIPFAWRRGAVRWADACLGRAAARLASQTGSALVSYSYYGYSAFTHCDAKAPKILFQLHPHPYSVRRILASERLRFPECEQSLAKEWELALPEEDFARLVAETTMADYWMTASSFTSQTLIENGVPAERIRTVPYGIDAEAFQPVRRDNSAGRERPLRLLFVGTINQRKGIKYLLDSMGLLNTSAVELMICGRVVDDLAIVKSAAGKVQVRPNVSAPELVAAYQWADLFVFPSLAEGFGHVLLEALASGVPIVATARTSAPDLISHGREGFIVPAGSAAALAEAIQAVLDHPSCLREMRVEARRTAEAFSWPRFRRDASSFVREVCADKTAQATRAIAMSHV